MKYFDKFNNNSDDKVKSDPKDILENKPENKITIKINREYNVGYQSDYNFDSINDIYKPELLLKIFKKQNVTDLTK